MTSYADKSPADLLDIYQSNAGCRYPGPQRKADRAARQLRDYLTDEQLRRLAVTRSHHRIGEGRGEIDDVCEWIREQWQHVE